jgi:hypothetical protein
MGKRSEFERNERDYYPTPVSAVRPLIDHLPNSFTFAEPCAGDGRLANHIQALTFYNATVTMLSDVEPQAPGIATLDAFAFTVPNNTDYIITNPPWDRKILHPMIEHFSHQRPTWLLFDADWMHTAQSAELMKLCEKIVSVGRVKWIPNSPSVGKDNCAWYLFDAKHRGPTVFSGR